jgi:hypothetical protein
MTDRSTHVVAWVSEVAGALSHRELRIRQWVRTSAEALVAELITPDRSLVASASAPRPRSP